MKFSADSFLSGSSSLGMRKQSMLAWLVLAFAGALAVRRWIWMPVLISGQSMLPTLHHGQIVGLNKLAYVFHSPRRGDIVTIWTGQEYITKRVVGLPGEQVAAHNGVFILNGDRLPEPYVKLPGGHSEIRSGTIESNCFVVAGDNRGPGGIIAVVSKERIIGRIIQFGQGPP
jgi:signal peptidase I